MRNLRFLVPALLLPLIACGGGEAEPVVPTVDPAGGAATEAPAAEPEKPAVEAPKNTPEEIANTKLVKDAYTKAAKLKKDAEAAGAESPAQQQLETFCKEQSGMLAGKPCTRMGFAYLGMLQGMGGMHQDAVLTLRKAVHDPRPSKYEANFMGYLVTELVDKGDLTEALVELERMGREHTGKKETKRAAMAVGMALRGAKQYADSAKALEIALAEREMSAIKPLVNSYLLANNKDAAVKTIQGAYDKGADHQKTAMAPLLDITKRFGTPVQVDFAAFAPGPGPVTDDKVLVLGVWNPSAVSMKWTLQVIEAVDRDFRADGVVALAVSTYYKKDETTGTIRADMTPEEEHGQGLKIRDQWGLGTQLAFVKDEAVLRKLGMSGLPYFIVLGKDRKVLFSLTMNRKGKVDTDILYDVLEKAVR